ncbi:galactose-3-O-sulfotransferase 2-like [Haliotis cracherodii]|uniref:galactose-3-O-sulfotransferase 2-like n=1 Tax=Haliotis cracherodii TaxID=6455 RepID=UPI0039EB5372
MLEKHMLKENPISGHQLKEAGIPPANTLYREYKHRTHRGFSHEVKLDQRPHREQHGEDTEEPNISSEKYHSQHSRNTWEQPNIPSEKYHSQHSRNTCSPKHNVAFLKVHKAGSSTVANILQRFAVRNDLNVVLPDKLVGESGFNILGYGPFFSANMVIPVPEGQTFNVLCNHVVYNRVVLDKLMPPGTFYVAIVRSLEERFISAMNYFGQVYYIEDKMKMTGAFKREDILSHFFTNQKVHGIYKESIINSIAYDFGFPTYSDNEEYAQSYLQKIDKEFDFVMIMEYFDESLVLLRRRLCWGLRDILYIKHNSNRHPVLPLAEEDRQKLYESQKLDHRIYKHFYRKFWDEILAEGRDIFDEVANFKLVQKQVFDFCSSDEKHQRVLDIPSSKWNEDFRLTAFDCRGMLVSELMQVQELMDRARERLRRDGTQEQWGAYVQNFRHNNKMRMKNIETYNDMFYVKTANVT